MLRFKKPDGTISIHAPREGGDVTASALTQAGVGISIHAPREGGDTVRFLCLRPAGDFNPRPPRGGRLAERGQ